MQIKHTYLVKDQSGILRTLYYTFSVSYYLSDVSVPGKFNLISPQEASKLL